jgi:Zn-dependent M16 (insulinase) family peptidase
VEEKCLLQIRRRNFISNLMNLFCSRMEETVRCMLQYKARSEQLKQEKTNLTVAYEVSQHSYVEDYLPPAPDKWSVWLL